MAHVDLIRSNDSMPVLPDVSEMTDALKEG